MNAETAAQFVVLLKGLKPPWIFAILLGVILAHRSPRIVKEIFAGIRSLMTIRARSVAVDMTVH